MSTSSNKIQGFSEHWDFFRRDIDGWPVSIRYDMGVRLLAEDIRAQYPHTIEFTVPYAEPTESGFPTKPEMERVNQIEDDFSCGTHNIRIIGVLTGGNCSRFVFCFSGTAEDVDSIVQTLMGPHPGTNFTHKVFLDDNFSYFNSTIAPTAYEINRKMNRLVCENLANHGEIFETTREIDFFCYFATEQYVQAISEQLCSQGFREVHRGQTDQGDYGLHLVFEGIPVLDWINEITDGILNLLEGTDGHFDGWGCPTHGNTEEGAK